MTIDRLARQGAWRQRPMAEKAFLALGLLTLAVTLPPWPGAALVLAVAVVATLAAARVPLVPWLRLMLAPLAFVATGAVGILVEWDSGPHVSAAGAAAAAAVALRSAAAAACLLLLACTTPMTDLLQGARRLGLPAELADVVLATWRFLFLLDDTARTMAAGQAARLGHHGARRRLRSAGLLAAALLPRAMERARRLEAGLAARGFDGALPTLAPETPLSARRLAGIAVLLAAVAGIGLWTR